MIPYIDTPLSQREADGIRGLAEHIDRQAMEITQAKRLLREALEQLKCVEWEVCIGVIGRIEAFLANDK